MLTVDLRGAARTVDLRGVVQHRSKCLRWQRACEEHARESCSTLRARAVGTRANDNGRGADLTPGREMMLGSCRWMVFTRLISSIFRLHPLEAAAIGTRRGAAVASAEARRGLVPFKWQSLRHQGLR